MTFRDGQLALALECDEHFLIHDINQPGFVSLLSQASDGRKRQRSYKLSALPGGIEQLEPGGDTWISQGEFRKPNRRAVNLWRMPVAFVDIDTYKVPSLQGLPVSTLLARLLLACEDEAVPAPSLVVWSGRGLQAKWIFDKPVPSAALPRWQALENELCRRLAKVGADPMAKDVSRVLRLVGTINSKSGERVRVVHQASAPTHGGIRQGGIIVYSFDSFVDEMLPHTRGELVQLRESRGDTKGESLVEFAARDVLKGRVTVVQGGKSGRRAGGNLRPFIQSQLAWDRLGDVRKLAELRGWTAGAPAGERNLPLFLCACFLAQAVVAPRIELELDALAREIAPTWTAPELASCVSSTLARARASARGETVDFDGMPVDPRYRWKNATLIEHLQVTAEEERQLTTIISQAESRRRGAERSRAARERGGAKTRQAWLESHDVQRHTARDMRSKGATWAQIADECDYSTPDAARMACKAR
ncbi:MAG: replication protein [Denitromonas halophila]|nr:MAG: replication protein [Denitromonas halophila]TVT72855.1 MAG: replication protein [Denitromonas halophila]